MRGNTGQWLDTMQSMHSVCFRALQNIRCLPIISGNNSRIPDPVHGAAALGEAVHGGHPLGVRQVAVRVPNQAAGLAVLDTESRGYKLY